ncbi:hypothetical protein AMJ40_06770 [candidate division TA06 bacterium DG_26]|uniref:FlgD Ig-like domain-containing protein n=1 Tax=candidate division TA06 bacterium DG_26 TaxID=1703771 RepID=A0A0S7WFE7_UNCT6|nr:MAG: hypothetical protein AMJ40_06770 [candidate division TA06 bacterium DG_26]
MWYYYDFTAQTFGLASGYWLDFPDLVLGENYLYLTSNYVWEDDAFVSGTSIRRLPLDPLSTGSGFSYNYYRIGDRYSFRATHGADTTMYWAAHNTTSSIRIYHWTEGSGTIYYDNVAVTAWNDAVRTAPGPDGRDWLGYADGRVLGAWVSDAFEPGGALGFMWSASQGGSYPCPYVHVARFRLSDRTLINEPIVWNPTFAFAYPSVNVNGRDHIAGSIMYGGGPYYPSCGVFIWDDYSVTPPGWEFHMAWQGNSGPYINRSGDYLSTRPCHPYSNTWIATAFTLQGGPNNSHARPRFLWFGRERDIPRPEPQNLYAFNGYHEAVPLMWEPPSGHAPLNSALEPSQISAGIPPKVHGSQNREKTEMGSTKQTLLSYNIYRSSTPGGPYTLIANVDRQYYRDESVTNGNTYYYVVTAVYDIVEESGYSNESAGSPVFEGYYINSGWAPVAPILNGLIEPVEWRTASAVDMTAPGVSPSVTLYVMNDDGHLYLAVDDSGNITLDDWDQFGPYFDEDHDYEWPPSSPSGEGNFWVQYFTAGSRTDFRGIYGWWPSHYGADAPVVAPGVNQAIGSSSGHVQFEVEIDLATSELDVTTGDVIGWFIYAQIMPEAIFSGWWPQEHALSAYPWDAWLVPATYGDLALATAPDIDVSPSSFTFVVPEGGVASDHMAIWNTASPPAGDLAWAITSHEVTLSLRNGESLPVYLRAESDWMHTAGVADQFDWEAWRRDVEDATRLSDVVSPVGRSRDGAAKGIGDILDFFPAPNPQAVGVKYDPDWDAVWVTDEGGAQLFLLEPDPPYGVISTLTLPASVPGGPDDIAIVGDVLYITDYNGDLTTFDDVIYAVDKVSGALIDTWELDGAGNPNPSDSIDGVVGITTMGVPEQFFVTNHTDPLIRLVELQPGGMWLTLATFLSPVGGPTAGIDWDPSVGGFWVTNIAGRPAYLTDGIFNPIGSFPTPGTVTSGITSLHNGTLWASDFGDGMIYVLEGLLAECIWLSQSPSVGIVPAGGLQYVDVTVDATGLGAGTYECEMHIHSNDPDESPWIVPVTLIVPEPPDIAVSPSSLTFTVPPGGSDSQTLTVNNTALPGALDLMWHMTEQEVTLALTDGRELPVHVQPTALVESPVEYRTDANPPCTGPAPRDLLHRDGQPINTRYTARPLSMMDPTDSGFGPVAMQDVMAEVVLNNPETLVLHGGLPSGSHYPGAEFGNAGDFSFMYGLDYATDEFVTIDVGTGTVTSIGTATPYGSEAWTGLAMDPTDGTMYASGTDIIQSSLYTVNVATGVVTRIGEITNAPAIIAIAVSPWGEMYGLDIVNDVLVRIDKTTGAGAVIGPIGFNANYSQGMDFDESDGTLYLSAFNNDSFQGELRIADVFTGTTFLVGPLGSVFPGGTVEITGFGVATVGPDCPWLAEAPMSGVVAPSGAQDVDVMVDATGLAEGDYECHLVIRSNDPDEPTVNVPVQLAVREPDIAVSPPSFSDTLCIGESIDRTLTISNTGGSALDWSLSESPSVGWLSESPTSGSILPASSDDVTVSFDATGLSAGIYNTTLVITSNDPDEPTVNVPVQLTVREPDISVSPDSFAIVLPATETMDTILIVCNAGGCVLSCSLYVSPPVNWLSVGDTNLTVDPGACDTVDLYLNTAGLSVDIFNTTVVIMSNDPDEPTLEVPVQLTVTGLEEIQVGALLPVAFDMLQNIPNPARHQTRVLYQLPREAHVLIQVYDKTGTLIKTLIDDIQQAGYRSVLWNGQDEYGQRTPSGVYFYRIQAGDFTSTKMMILLR